MTSHEVGSSDPVELPGGVQQNEPEARRSRRAVLRTGALALGASVAAVTAGARNASAADGENIEIGVANSGSNTTNLSSSPIGGEAFRGTNTATTGVSDGLYGVATAPAGAGVRGFNSANTGDSFGVLGSSNSSNGVGVDGSLNLSPSIGTGVGVRGTSNSGDGTGVQGINTALSGVAAGVLGTSSSTEGFGVLGSAVDGDDSIGVGGEGGAVGVRGEGGLYGVVGVSSSIGGVLAGGDFGAGIVGDVRITGDGSDFDPPTPVAPAAPLHVIRDGSGDPVQLMLQLESDTAPQQTFVNNTTSAKWFFAMTSDDEFKISRDGTSKVEAKFFANGNLNLAGTLNQASDVNVKHDLADVNAGDVLERLAAMPVKTWKYDADPDVTHLGPTAQDFKAAFDLGESDTTIATVDANGVALAAIQALHQQNQHLQAQLDELRGLLS